MASDSNNDIEKGYACDCGQYHEFPPYVYAHWTIDLNHTCTECGRINRIREGAAENIVAPDPKLKKELD